MKDSSPNSFSSQQIWRCRAEPNLHCTSHIWVLTRWWGWELLPGDRLTHGLERAEDLLTFRYQPVASFLPALFPASQSFTLCCSREAALSSHMAGNFSSWFLGGVMSHTNHSVMLLLQPLMCLETFNLLPSTGEAKSRVGWALVSHSPSSRPRGPTRAGISS